MVDWLNHLWYIVDESDGSRDVIEHRYFSHLLFDISSIPWPISCGTYLPRAWDVLQKLHDSMRDVFEGSQVYTFVIPELLIRHISMILDDLSNVLRRQILGCLAPLLSIPKH